MLKMNRLVLTSVALTACLLAQSAAFSATVSAERLKRLDATLQQYVDEHRIGGAVALVLKDGKPIYEKAVGWRDKEASKPMTTDTVFRIASQTKALTSVAILMLMEEGKIALSNPVAQFIPEYAKTTVAELNDGAMRIVPAKRAITIKDLLTHTAGISYGTQAHISHLYAAKSLGPAAGNSWYTADKDEPICDTMAQLASLPFVAHPGEAWVYGYNTDILGCVAERASGIPLNQFIRTRITGPLKMRDTHFFLPPEQRERLAIVYSSADGKVVRAPDGAKGQGHYVEGPRKSFAGGAGLVSTARDYARFLEMIRNGGALDGVRILAPRTVALMRTNQSGTLHADDGSRGFGLGFQTTERFGANSLESVGSYGWGGAYGSMYRIDPELGLTIVFMINQLPLGTDAREKFHAMVYQALL
jgi:CubicO group peptidase (beta-lactamase class C family)